MLRVIDYFSAVDRNGDNRVELDEALDHCFPYVPKMQLVTMKKWLYPQKYDEGMFQELNKFAAAAAKASRSHFIESLEVLKSKSAELLMKSTHEDDIARVKDLQSLKKGFVSEFTLVSILKKNKKFEQDASDWMNKNKADARQHVDSLPNPNYFSATIFAISSAIQKLSRHQSAQHPNSASHSVPLYRGYKDTIVPENLSGICEFGFLSSSRNQCIAEQIARTNDPEPAKRILILQIEAPIGGFADISQYSQ
jgi:hypothetical protein